MQTFLKKILNIFSIISLTSSQIAISQPVNISILNEADLALKEKKIDLADSLYKSFLMINKDAVDPNIYLKVSYIALLKKNYVDELIWLDHYLVHKPSELVIDKMNEIAIEYNLDGYEKNSLIFIKNIFKIVLPYFLMLFIPFCFFTIYQFYKRKLKGEVLKRSPIFVLILFIFTIYFLVNVEGNLNEAIVINDNAIIKESPNATVGGIQQLQKGTKLNVIGNSDIWLRVIIDKTYYIKKTDVYLIKP